MEIFLLTETWIALATLTFLEVVLGVDNIIFISIISNKLPHSQQEKARLIGLVFAMVFRIALLLGITYIIRFNEPLLSIFGFAPSGKDLILIGGGLFLLFKFTLEISHKMEGKAEEMKANVTTDMAKVIFQIILLDAVFSFDSTDRYRPGGRSDFDDHCGGDLHEHHDSICRQNQQFHQ